MLHVSPKKAQDDPRWPQTVARRPQARGSWADNGLKLVQDSSKWAQAGTRMGPNWSKIARRWSQVSRKMNKKGQGGAQMATG